MTEELKQKAEEYCNTKLLFTFETELVQKIVKMFAKQAYIAGATEATKKLQEENRWHDLRKFPADFPPQREKVFIAQEYDKYNLRGGEPMIAWRDGGCWFSMNEGHEESIGWKVYAWHKIPKIPEEYK